MNILFLDDDQKRHDTLTKELARRGWSPNVLRAYTVEDARRILSTVPIDIAYLDHDLGGQVMVKGTEGTGKEVAQIIANMSSECRVKRVIVHSWNPDGALEMVRILSRVRVRATHIMFGTAGFYDFFDPRVLERKETISTYENPLTRTPRDLLRDVPKPTMRFRIASENSTTDYEFEYSLIEATAQTAGIIVHTASSLPADAMQEIARAWRTARDKNGENAFLWFVGPGTEAHQVTIADMNRLHWARFDQAKSCVDILLKQAVERGDVSPSVHRDIVDQYESMLDCSHPSYAETTTT